MSSSPVEPLRKRLLVMADSNDQQTNKPNLVAMPTSLNHISVSVAVNQKQQEQDQTFGNTPNHFHGSGSQTLYFPPGYRFCPLDSELIIHYLQKKVNNEALLYNVIREVNLYQHNPEYLTAQYPPALGYKKWYFFTPRERKYPNGVRPNRATSDGYWKPSGADKPVEHEDKVIGIKKALVYYQGKPRAGQSKKTNWLMHEFRVVGPPRIKESLHDMKLDDWVLCSIYKKEEKGEVQRQVAAGKGKKGTGVEAQHKPNTLLKGSTVNDNGLVGESSKYHDKYTDEFVPYNSYMLAASDPQPSSTLGYNIDWPFAAGAPPVHLDYNKYFAEESDNLDDF